MSRRARGVIGFIVRLIRRNKNPNKDDYYRDRSPAKCKVHKHQNRIQTSRPKKWSIELIKSIDWLLFERLCAAYFVVLGRRAEVNHCSGPDGEIDISLYNRERPDELMGIAQCKAWLNKPVGVEKIRRVFWHYDRRKCYPWRIFYYVSLYTRCKGIRRGQAY